MPQLSKKNMSKEVSDQINQLFVDTVVRAKNEAGALEIIKELLTRTERVMLGQRLIVIYLLAQGYDYRSISRALNVSLTTIAKMNHVRADHEEGLVKLVQVLLLDPTTKDFLGSLEGTLSAAVNERG